MEPWWFLEPLLYTCMVIAAIGMLAAWIWNKITDGESMAPAVIATISTIHLGLTRQHLAYPLDVLHNLVAILNVK